MARGKKEARKPTIEERLKDRWEQQVFFIKKLYPQAERDIQTIRKNHQNKQKDFLPTEEALHELVTLYADLRQAPTGPSAFV